MNLGRRLLIDKSTKKILMELGEEIGASEARPNANDLIFIDLEYGQYDNEFSRLKDGFNSINIVDIENKIFEFDLKEPTSTPEQQIAELQQQLLQAQGVV